MFGKIFRPAPLMDPGTTSWILDTCGWVLTEFGTDPFYEATPLVLPTDEFFPQTGLDTPSEFAMALFTQVKKHAGMTEWACELRAQDADPMAVVAPTVVVEGVPTSPAGTFSVSEDAITITYNPDQLNRPESLVATFAHELAHYLSFSTSVRPPGGEDFEEPATDFLALFLGFGIFLANSAYQFSQYAGVDSQGWSSRSQGYLSQDELVYGLALFAELKGLQDESVVAHLDTHLRSFFRKSRRDIKINFAAEFQKLSDIRSGSGNAGAA